MKYCRILTQAGPRYADVVEREGELWVERILPPKEEARRLYHAHDIDWYPIRLEHAHLLAPVEPGKIVCIGRNYRDHAQELGNEVPAEPLVFLKAPSAVIASGAPIVLPPQSSRVDFEGELGVVIGKRASRIGRDEDVRGYIRGYTLVNDVTARDLQKSDGQWSRAKGFDTFCPVGPFVSDEIALEAGVTIETRLNGEVKQHGSTRDLIFPVAELLRYISSAMTLEPGDVIPTGTPAGVGPMQAGDTVEVEVHGLGVLRNPVIASPAS
jgi:2-keto-4-pentenoate hydratase/2-oxohepta-3-ene-1,7-dioic acid hydratase in catechol pathway